MDKMTPAKMKRCVKTLQQELGKLGPVMRGSVVVIGPRYKQSYFSQPKTIRPNYSISASTHRKRNEPENTPPITKSTGRSLKK